MVNGQKQGLFSQFDATTAVHAVVAAVVIIVLYHLLFRR